MGIKSKMFQYIPDNQNTNQLSEFDFTLLHHALLPVAPFTNMA